LFLIEDSSVKNSIYDLFGVVNHSGSLYGGHYTAYYNFKYIYISDCLSPIDNRWYRFNDSSVHEINISSQGYHTTGGSSPYILFYAKKNLFKWLQIGKIN
jgi:ubiquitin C-terminal hydrolase